MIYQQSMQKWQHCILMRLKERDDFHHSYSELILAYNRLQEKNGHLQLKHMHLTVENEQLKTQLSRCSSQDASSTGIGTFASVTSQALEQKLIKLQEKELEFLREKDKLNTQVYSLMTELQEKEREVQVKDSLLASSKRQLREIQDERDNLLSEVDKLVQTNQALTDELQANQLAYKAVEAQFRKVADENAELLERWMHHKGKIADKMNEQNEFAARKRQEKLRRDLEEAAKDPVNITESSTSDISLPTNVPCIVHIPQRVQDTVEAHDGEVNGVRWSPSGKLFASAGTDRKVKLWNVSQAKIESRGFLTGSNASVTSLDFDLEDQLIAASSNDYAARIWSIADQRLKACLTGHSNKVLATRFLGVHGKLVTGSHDRTLKIWDLRNRACIKTIFAFSSCNDLITSPTFNDMIISGHFDRKLRLYDARGENSITEITLGGRITGLDISPDGAQVLVSARDDILRIIDLRMYQVSQSLSADGFHVGLDYARCSFSPDGQYAVAGTERGDLYFWSVASGRFEKSMRGEHTSTVIGVSWHPAGAYLVSCDRNRRINLWC